jgi:hypothetical protein
MKMALLVNSSVTSDRVTQLLAAAGIDYYTRWEHAKGKGAGTEPHLGWRPFGDTNDVTMIAFEDEAPLKAVIAGVRAANRDIHLKADQIRLFQLPLERIV